jgi:hypothetical protein
MHPETMERNQLFRKVFTTTTNISVGHIKHILPTMASITSSRPWGRLWSSYLAQLAQRPLRTKMITSGVMFVIADGVTQFGIEGRRLGIERLTEGKSAVEEKGDGYWEVIICQGFD